MDLHPPASLVATVEAGTVRVGIRIPAPVERAWLALLDPAQLRQWFGELDTPWRVGTTGRIEFGDGDFFVVTPTEIVAERLLAFEWSFLGVGPTQQIRWKIMAKSESAAELIVEDADPARTAAEADQMVAGWTDFLSRLVTYLGMGVPTRYAWRADIDGSADLPVGFRPLRIDTIYRWLPVASDGFKPCWFFIVDDEGPRRFPVENWRLQLDRELTFSIAIPDTVSDTTCTVALGPATGETRRLRFTHTGWDRLGVPSERGRTLRRRFAVTWIAALDQAKNLASTLEGRR